VGGVYLNQLYTFSDPTRDPRRHTITIAYYGLFPTAHQRANPYPLEDAWVPLRGAIRQTLAFDHARILSAALERLQGRLDYTSDAYRLLPDRFTIPQLQRVHELVLGQPLKADAFTKRALRNGLRSYRTKETVANEAGGRPARLYRNPAVEAS
jgi:8-oxo-dGTP diphosphatase